MPFQVAAILVAVLLAWPAAVQAAALREVPKPQAQPFGWIGSERLPKSSGVTADLAAASTTYSYLCEGSASLIDLAPTILVKSGLVDDPLRDRLEQPADVTYTIVESEGALRPSGRLPAAMAVFASSLCALGAVAWRRQHRRDV